MNYLVIGGKNIYKLNKLVIYSVILPPSRINKKIRRKWRCKWINIQGRLDIENEELKYLCS